MLKRAASRGKHISSPRLRRVFLHPVVQSKTCDQNHSQGEARTRVQMQRRSEELGQITQSITRLTLRELGNKILLCAWKDNLKCLLNPTNDP